MKRIFLGDTLDIVKRCILSSLSPIGLWTVCPMFTDNFTNDDDVDTYEILIGARVLTRSVIDNRYQNRDAYFNPYKKFKGHLFLDPDTGIKTKKSSSGHNKYIYENELLGIINNRTSHLTLVFDQSYSNDEKPINIISKAISDKFNNLAQNKVYYCAYVSHAIFMLFGRDLALIEKGVFELRKNSNLPESRFLKSYTT